MALNAHIISHKALPHVGINKRIFITHFVQQSIVVLHALNANQRTEVYHECRCDKPFGD